MQHYLTVYHGNPLFADLDDTELLALLECLHAEKRHYPKSSVIQRAGDAASEMGIVLAGRINTVYDDVFGTRNILDSLERGQLFCEAFSFAQNETLPVSVVAQTDCDVLMMNGEYMMHTCEKACLKHRILKENLIRLLSEKYIALNQKNIHLSGRTIRRKLLSYLSEQARLSGGDAFTIPFDRQELADYLFVERSALSAELGRLRREGVIDFNRRTFRLLKHERAH